MTAPSPAEQLFNHCAEAARAIHKECTSILSSKNQTDASSLAGCGPALVELLSRQARHVGGCYENLETAATDGGQVSPQNRPLVLRRLEDIGSIAYSKFYAFVYKDLPVCWRQLYTDAGILKFCFLLLRSPYLGTGGTACARDGSDQPAEGGGDCSLDELVKILDLALILAGAAGEKRGRRWVDGALELLQAAWMETPVVDSDDDDDGADTPSRPVKRTKLSGNPDRDVISSDGIRADETFSTHEPFTPPVRHPIRRVDALSMEAFQTHMDRPQDPTLGPEPLIIQNTLTGWPALTTHPWNRPSYLLSRTFDGRRLVPVEIGRSYVDEGWGQKLITFGEFLRSYIDPSLSSGLETHPHPRSSPEEDDDNIHAPAPSPAEAVKPTAAVTTVPMAYLAQHPLLTQLPTLRNDILVPDYCYTSPPPPPYPHPTDGGAELEAPLLNAWFGPPETITPLHNDPYHNVLAQVVGRKYVRLYGPREAGRMRARGREHGVEMGNTSLVDVGVVEGWDGVPGGEGVDDDGNFVEEEEDEEEEQEEGGGGGGEGRTGRSQKQELAAAAAAAAAFREIPYVDCILEPGDVLYIPVGWWHYVRGLSVSFSVSFWWN